MKNKLPVININKKYIKLNLKEKSDLDEEKINKINHPKNKRAINTSEKTSYKFHISKNINMKAISLTRLANRRPKKLNMIKSHIPPNLSMHNFHFKKKTSNNNLVHNSSAKFISTNSLLKRLSPGIMDELEKYEYYDKIENTKSYKEFLKREKEVIPKDSLNNSFVDNNDENGKNKNDKKLLNYFFGPKQSSYDLLYLFNPKNMIKLWHKFDKKEEFEKYIIEKFVRYKKKHLEEKNELDINKRNIYIILDGDIIINEKYIKGFFIEIPKIAELNSLNNDQRKIIFNSILEKSQNIFKTKKPLINIFSPDKQYISNIYEIKTNFEYLYVSPNMVCVGASVLTTRPLMKIYENYFLNYLKEKDKQKEIQKKLRQKFLFMDKFRHIYRIKNLTCGIKTKYEKYKPHYSFAEGENNIENVDYVIYSDDEDRKKSKEKDILNNCYLKNDFFLYINENDIKKKTSELKKNLTFTETYNLRQHYKEYKPDFDNLLEKYKKEIYHQLRINPKIFIVDPIDSKINSHNLEFPDDKLENLYISRRNQKRKNFKLFQQNYLRKQPKHKQIKDPKYTHDPFYHNLARDVNKYYNPLILYNIPKLLKEFKNFTRKRIYELYSKYKDLITMAYTKNKDKYILQNGVDFDTFWRCMDTFSDEKKEFATKIYNQINRREICFLSMEDFLSGMYYMHNSDLTRKLELFLKMLDKSGKGSISFNEAVEICKESIQRSFGEKGDEGTKDKTALNQMSEFFAGFVFQLIGIDKRNNLEIDVLRKAVISKENELNEFEYLEMFCGANI